MRHISRPFSAPYRAFFCASGLRAGALIRAPYRALYCAHIAIYIFYKKDIKRQHIFATSSWLCHRILALLLKRIISDKCVICAITGNNRRDKDDEGWKDDPYYLEFFCHLGERTETLRSHTFMISREPL